MGAYARMHESPIRGLLVALAVVLSSTLAASAAAQDTVEGDAPTEPAADFDTEPVEDVAIPPAPDGDDVVVDEEPVEVEEISLRKLLEAPLDYGFEDIPISTHVYLTTALWWLGDQAFGDYANEPSSLSGFPAFVTYSAYVNLRGRLHDTLFAEAEFELYKGEKGEFKVTRVRGVWRPVEYFQLSLGRDFPPIGVQDKVYYPTSQFRLFAHAPYLYHSILRATGWWDTGVHLSGHIPLPFINDHARINLALSGINGPGDRHKGAGYLEKTIVPNADGYMYEAFHDDARQPWDNNKGKFFPVRLSLSLFEGMDVGASMMTGKYDSDDAMSATYWFAHALYKSDRLTIAAEYGQIAVDVDPANMMDTVSEQNMTAEPVNTNNGTFGDDLVTQRSGYVSAGYRVIYKQLRLQYLEPVVRYEYMDAWVEDDLNLSDRHVISIGLRMSFLQGWTIKTDYSFQFEDPNLDNDWFILENVFEF